MIAIRYFVPLLLIFLPASAYAQRNPNPMEACNNPKQSNLDRSGCLSKVQSKISRELAVAYKERLARVSPANCKKDELPEYFCKPERTALEKSQKAFLLYLKEQCNNLVPASYGAGSGAGIASQSCEIVLSSYRISELRGQEGYELVPTTGGMVDYPTTQKDSPKK